MPKTWISAVRIDVPVDWHRSHAGAEKIKHLIYLKAKPAFPPCVDGGINAILFVVGP